MKSVLYLLLALSTYGYADTIDHYINIANNIPQMEMKADPQSQAWARSARNILTLTSECIAESLLLANESLSSQGAPLFCLPNGETLGAAKVNDLIQQTYQEISSRESDKNKMTVSQVALIGLKKRYPCQKENAVSGLMDSSNRSDARNQISGMQHQSNLYALGN